MQIDPHHGIDGKCIESSSLGIGDALDLTAAVKALGPFEDRIEFGHRRAVAKADTTRPCSIGVGVWGEDVRVELDPQVPQRVRRLVSIPDRFGAVNRVVGFIQTHVDGVVDPLLPVVWPRLATCAAVRVRGWEDFFELTKFILLAVFAVWERLTISRSAS